MKVISIATALVGFSSALTVATSPEQQSVAEIQKMFNAFSALQQNSLAEKRTDACYLNIFSSSEKVKSCPSGLESFGGECFEECNFFGFCIPLPTSVLVEQPGAMAMPYKRDPVNVAPVCSSNALLLENICYAAAECPALAPYKCGFVCMKDQKVCQDSVGKVVGLIVNLVTKIQSGDLVGVAFTLKDIYDFVTSFPPCAQDSTSKLVTEIISIFGA